MDQIPAFTVRSYHSFSFRRYYRVYVGHDALYLIRMRGLIGTADVRHHSPGDLVEGLLAPIVNRVVAWWVGRSLARQAKKLDARGPRELLATRRGTLRIEPCEVKDSRIEEGYGVPAVWTLKRPWRLTLYFCIEDEASLKTAVEHLPRLMGPDMLVWLPNYAAAKSAQNDKSLE